ncbi:MAG: hypothetical protein AAF745_13235 [Planctomycetota bacterium]
MNTRNKMGCPTLSVLMEFDSGKLDDIAIQELGEHLTTCATCCDQIDRLSESAGSLSKLFRGLEAAPGYETYLQESQMDWVLNQIAEQTVE